jgi:hypothetical protein
MHLNKQRLTPRQMLSLTMWKRHLLPTIHLQRLVQAIHFLMKKASICCASNKSHLISCKEANKTCKQAILEKRLSGYRDTVAAQGNCFSKLEAGGKATKTELKAKLGLAQLAAKENMGSLLARVRR